MCGSNSRFGFFLSGFRCDGKRIDLSRDRHGALSLAPYTLPLALFFQQRLHQVARTVAYLLVDAPDVFTEQADAEQRDADQEEHQRKQREQALRFRADYQAAHHEKYEEHGREYRDQHPQHGEHLQRHQREAGHQVEIQADQAVQRILGFARSAFLVSNDHLGGIARKAVGQRRDEGVHLLAAIDRVDDMAAVGAEHAALIGHLDARDAFAQPVHRLRCDMPPPAVATLTADRADVIMTLVHLRQQQADVLRRILQISVQRHYALPARLLKSSHDRHVLAEVAVEQDHPRHIRTLLELLAQYRGGTVAAAVVDEHDLIRNAELVQRRVQPVEQALQALLFVIDGNDDGKLRGIHGTAFYRTGQGERNPTAVIE